jgi:D-threo-aldose 1-dehydrogenase
MQYRRFGRTGLEVSAVGFGCGRVGGLLIDGSDEAHRRAVRRALDLGINWFDTAESYGNGKSEEALGWLLAEVPEKPNVSTKVTLDPRQPDLAAQVIAHARACLKRLRREAVTVLQVHNRMDDLAGGRALTADDVLGKGGVLDGLERAKAVGLARFVGFSALGDRATILKVMESGRFDSVQVYYNLVNPSAARAMPPAWTGQSLTGLIDAARQNDMGVIAIRVLDGGIIATDDRKKPVSMMAKETDEPTEVRKSRAALNALGEGLGTRPQMGLRFALSCPDIGVSLIGIGAPEHVEQAAEAVAMGPLPAEALARLESVYERDFT